MEISPNICRNLTEVSLIFRIIMKNRTPTYKKLMKISCRPSDRIKILVKRKLENFIEITVKYHKNLTQISQNILNRTIILLQSDENIFGIWKCAFGTWVCVFGLESMYLVFGVYIFGIGNCVFGIVNSVILEHNKSGK